MTTRPILLALLALLVGSVLLVGAPATVAANGDHDHGDDDADGSLPDWVPDLVGYFLSAIGGLFGELGRLSAGIGRSSSPATLGVAQG